eukprot:1192701-Prorocentrum_minimum.AAC.7
MEGRLAAKLSQSDLRIERVSLVLRSLYALCTNPQSCVICIYTQFNVECEVKVGITISSS